jgi:hypothetical protein
MQDELFCAGVEKIKGSDSFTDHSGLIACWGTDWPVTDTVKYKKETVGLAACVPESLILKEATDDLNYLYVLSPEGRSSFTYHIMFTSRKETFGIKSKKEWFHFAESWKKKLITPCDVVLSKTASEY